MPESAATLGASAAYAVIGSTVGQDLRIERQQWSPEQLEAFLIGLRASAAGRPYAIDETSRPVLEEFNRRIQAARAAEMPEQVTEYLRQARERLNLQESDSGLLFRLLQRGAGPRPAPHDTVVVTISAKAPGQALDVPELTKNRARIRVDTLIPGVSEGVQMLALDGVALLLVPPNLSFSPDAWPPSVAPGTPLLYRIELHDIVAGGAGEP